MLKGGIATIAVGAGINSLLNGLGWVMGEGGKITKSVAVPVLNSNCAVGEYCWTSNGSKPYYASPRQACEGMAAGLWWGSDTQFTHGAARKHNYCLSL